MDAIQIKDLEIYCHHGVLKEENVLGQKFLVSLVMEMDTREAGKADDLSLSVSYDRVAHFVTEQMTEKNYQLLEAAAEHLAHAVLLEFPLIQRVEIEIKKPWAPLLLPLDTVSVKIQRGWTRVFLSLGSNMGDRERYIQNAIDALRREPMIRNLTVSEFIETEPYGYTDQPRFINAAVSLETLETPMGLLNICQKIEKDGKRERTIHWGPRTIDVDILLYGEEVVQTQELVIPHREMHRRMFVLEPLAQIAPWAWHPLCRRTVQEMLEERKGDGKK